MKNKTLLIILVLAFLWRFIGIYPGYPLHPDEGMSYSQGLAMLTEKTLDAHGYAYTYAYPNVVPMINAVLFKFIFIPLTWVWFFLNRITQLVDGVLQIIPSPLERERIFQTFILGKGGINPLYWGRTIAALFGFGSVVLSFVLGKRTFNRKIGLIWTFLMAANWRLVLGSHLGLPDIYNVFFLLLSIIFSFRISEKQNTKSFLLAGIFAGISFSVKFQIFSFICLFLCYLYGVFRVRKLNLYLIFISAFSSLLVILLINPYHLIHWETTLEQMSYVASKYGIGKKTLYIYPVSYLYHYAVGAPAVWMAFLGIVYAVAKKKYFRLFLFLSLIFSGLYLFAYYSGGGFYTRNLLTISPFILLFSALGIVFLIDFLQKIIKDKRILGIATVLLVLLVYLDQIKWSTEVAIFYTRKWNLQVLESWLRKNIPLNTKVAAHGNVPLPVADSDRLPFEEGISFSVDEFSKSGADYAVANFAWATNSFYWWMIGIPQEYMFNYFNKPVDLLEYTYPAIALRELSESMVYWVSKPWQAPDINFIVAKVPKYTFSKKSETVSYNFKNGEEGWKKSGKGWAKKDNLSLANEGLLLNAEPVLIPSTRWESPIINVEGWGGFVVEYKVNTLSDSPSRKGAYIFASFYESKADVEKSVNRVAVRLSGRKDADSRWEIKNLVGLVPGQAKYMTISFSSYDYVRTQSELNWLRIYKSDVKVDYGGVDIKPLKLNADDLFPNSHGGL